MMMTAVQILMIHNSWSNLRRLQLFINYLWLSFDGFEPTRVVRPILDDTNIDESLLMVNSLTVHQWRQLLWCPKGRAQHESFRTLYKICSM